MKTLEVHQRPLSNKNKSKNAFPVLSGHTSVNKTYANISDSPKSNIINRIKSANSKNITLDKEQLYESNLQLKNELNKVKNQLAMSKKENYIFEQEMKKKDKALEDMAIDTQNSVINNLSNVDYYNQNKLLSKATETHLILNLKKQFSEMKKELKRKNEELEILKKNTKSTRINELSIENKELNDEFIKLKNFYEISVQQNIVNEKEISELSYIRDEFSKQQYLIVALQDNFKIQEQEMKKLIQENNKLNTKISEKNQISLKLKKEINNLKLKKESQNTISHITTVVSQPIPEKPKKSELEKKLNVFKREVLYYKELCSKKESRIRELEKERSNNIQAQSTYVKYDENPEEHTNTTILLLKSKLVELRNQKDQLEKKNRELEERLKLTTNESYKEKSVSYDLLTDEQLNELVYILIKNLEASKIDGHIVETRLFNGITNNRIDSKSFFEEIFSNFINLLNTKNELDILQVGSFFKTFIHYHKNLNYDEFKDRFLSLWTSIIFYSVEDKNKYNRILFKKLIPYKKELKDSILFFDDNKTGFITFIQLRKILEKLNINLSSKLAEYVIYIMKCYISENENSIYDLKYENLLKLIDEMEKMVDKVEDIDEDEGSESGIEITPEEYIQITDKMIYKIGIKTDFKPDIYFKEYLLKENGYELVDLKNFLTIISDSLKIEIDDVEIYCLFNRFKFDEENSDDENMDYKKIKKEILLKKSVCTFIIQLKTYFNDHNITFDKFISGLSLGDEGYVEVSQFKTYLTNNNINIIVPDSGRSEMDPLFKDNMINIVYLRNLYYDEKKDESSQLINTNKDKFNNTDFKPSNDDQDESYLNDSSSNKEF